MYGDQSGEFVCGYWGFTCASTLALSTIVLESAIRPLMAQPQNKKP